MGILQDLLKDIPVPKMAKVKVKFDNTKIDDLEPALLAKLQQEHIQSKVKPGMDIAVAVGCRGLDSLV